MVKLYELINTKEENRPLSMLFAFAFNSDDLPILVINNRIKFVKSVIDNLDRTLAHLLHYNEADIYSVVVDSSDEGSTPQVDFHISIKGREFITISLFDTNDSVIKVTFGDKEKTAFAASGTAYLHVTNLFSEIVSEIYNEVE